MADLDEKKLKQVIDPNLAKAFTHPLRGHVWVTICERGIASPAEIADDLQIDVSDVSYHFRGLKRCKLIQLVRTVQRRGFSEHFYEPCQPAIRFDDFDWMDIPAAMRATFSADLLRQIIMQLIEAFNSGSFDARNRHLSQSWMLVDESGWEELMQAVEAVLGQFREIQKRCVARRSASSESGIPIAITMAAFETAPAISRKDTGKTESL